MSIIPKFLRGAFDRDAQSGTAIEAKAPGAPAAAAVAPEVSATLLVVSGPDAGLRIRVGQTRVGVVVGRGPGVRLALDGDRRVSARHCRVWWDAEVGVHRIEDLSSRNGTLLDDHWLPAWQGDPLADRDEVRVGRSVLLYARSGAPILRESASDALSLPRVPAAEVRPTAVA